MSTYNDYMVKLASGLTYKSAQYSRLVQQGIDDCCLKKQIQLLNMYWELLSTITADDCVDNDGLTAIIEHISCLLSTPIGSMTASDILTTSYGSSPGATTTVITTSNDEVADVVILDTGVHTITFEISDASVSLGSDPNGLDYALSTAAWLQASGLGSSSTISNRSASGFSVQIYENGVVFEYKAKLKT